MKNFFECLDNKFNVLKDLDKSQSLKSHDQEICEEVMLEVFAK